MYVIKLLRIVLNDLGTAGQGAPSLFWSGLFVSGASFLFGVHPILKSNQRDYYERPSFPVESTSDRTQKKHLWSKSKSNIKSQ